MLCVTRPEMASGGGDSESCLEKTLPGDSSSRLEDTPPQIINGVKDKCEEYAVWGPMNVCGTEERTNTSVQPL